ncbi:acyl carrier protein [Priestia megaterium]|uniref:acyl carrier protein n=1 Tax=Priestia megaterium TaxID=1404 RepID=UPI0015F6DFAC|nr:acyl carrier protein [Priestia megaterium]MEB4861267.1 acyl carrier protein [Priestia megaterium]
MYKELEKILKMYINNETLKEVQSHYEEWKFSSLFSVGIDSLSYMGILVELETNYNLTAEKMDKINNLYDIEQFLMEENKENV